MLARIKSARGQRAVCLPHHPTLCFFSVPPPLFSPLVVIFERNEWITTKHHQQQQQQLRSQWSDPGTASDLLHQALMEAWQIQHHMGGQGGGGQRRWAGPKGLSQSPCSICLPHPSPLHILRRAETASHAETNVKINHYDLSCSALTCSPLVTFAFHISSRVISSSPNIKKDSFYTVSTSLLHFMQNELQPQYLPPQCFPLAQHRTQKRLHGAAYAVQARERAMLMSHLDNEVWSWQDLSKEQLPLPAVRTWGLEVTLSACTPKPL